MLMIISVLFVIHVRNFVLRSSVVRVFAGSADLRVEPLRYGHVQRRVQPNTSSPSSTQKGPIY